MQCWRNQLLHCILPDTFLVRFIHNLLPLSSYDAFCSVAQISATNCHGIRLGPRIIRLDENKTSSINPQPQGINNNCGHQLK